MKWLLIKILLGRNKKYFSIINIRGIVYKVDIQPYESVEEIIEKATNSGVFMA